MSATSDIVDITQLIVHERYDRDHKKWDRFRDAYLPDSIVRVSWFEGSGPDFVEATRARFDDGDPGMHALTAVPVHLHGDRAIATVPLTIELNQTWDDVPPHLASVVIAFYGLEKRDGRWFIRSFECSYVRDSVTPEVPGDVIPVDRDLLASFRPSYRYLAYAVSRSGQTADPDLPGVDRPELVEAIEHRLQDWASATA